MLNMSGDIDISCGPCLGETRRIHGKNKASRACTDKALCVQCFDRAEHKLIDYYHELHVSGDVVHA